MEFRACHRYARIAPRKVRGVIDLIRGVQVNEALQILQFSNKRAAQMIDKVLRSAMATATEDTDVDEESLSIIEARVDEGPKRKWGRPRARGMWYPIVRRTSHITIVLSDGSDEELEENEEDQKNREE